MVMATSVMEESCDHCSKPAIYYRRYSGERTCKKHFIASVDKRVRREVRRYLRRDSRVGLAVSGGKDSLSMAHAMGKLRSRFPEMELVGLIVDEGIDGYRGASIEKAREALHKLGIEHRVFSFQEGFSTTLDEMVERSGDRNQACTFCGVLRRRALDRVAKESGVEVVLTGHNLDDLAQTVLLSIIQGNVRHLTQEPDFPGVVRREKPLRNLLEREVTLYALLSGIDYYDLHCPYTRSSLRNEVRNFLVDLEAGHSGVTYSIARTGEKIKTGERVKMGRCTICGYPTTRVVCKACEIIEGFERSG